MLPNIKTPFNKLPSMAMGGFAEGVLGQGARDENGEPAIADLGPEKRRIFLLDHFLAQARLFKSHQVELKGSVVNSTPENFRTLNRFISPSLLSHKESKWVSDFYFNMNVCHS